MQSALRTLSLSYNLLRGNTGWNKHDHIISGLFLGMIPIKDSTLGEDFSNSHEAIIDFVTRINPTRPLKLVVSVVEPDELLGKGFLGVTMVSAEDWKQHGIDQLILPMGDFKSAVDPDAAVKTIKTIKQYLDKGNSVYVHCKAGRSRSAMICAIYLASSVINPTTSKKYTLPEAISLLKDARTQIEIGNDKKQTAETIIEMLTKLPQTDVVIPLETLPLTALLIRRETKETVLDFTSIKALEEYAIAANAEKTPCKRSDYINNFIELIKKPLSEEWFFSLYDQKSFLQKFINTNPDFDSEEEKIVDKERRHQLVERIKKEVIDLVCRELNITLDELEHLTRL